MTASPRHMNFGAFSLAGVPMLGIKSFKFNEGLSDKRDGADGDPGPTWGVIDWAEPSFDITTVRIGSMITFVGVRGIFIATLLDSYNKAAPGGGGISFTTNALSYITDANGSAEYRDSASATFTVKTLWADPATPPVSVASL